MKRKRDLDHSSIMTANVHLSDQQQTALGSIASGLNVCLLGPAGCGKSTVINQFLRHLSYEDAKSVYITASTGIAADYIGGITLHSFAGIGLGKDSASRIATRMTPNIRRRWQTTKTLIIDEISMIDDGVFDLVNQVAKNVRESQTAFGGIQIIVSGDFCQLPPVKKDAKFCFESKAWRDCGFKITQLSNVFRQPDVAFASLLNRMRMGDSTLEDVKLLNTCVERKLPVLKPGIAPTELYCLRKELDALNLKKLKECKESTEHVYKAKDYGQTNLLKQCMFPETLALRTEAQVMCVENNQILGIVNGSRGVVTGFGFDVDERGQTKDVEWPRVLFENGKHLLMKPSVREIKSGNVVVASRQQLPLILAWSLTIHKAQGATLTQAIVNLDSAFSYGHHYVALSRVRSLDGLSLLMPIQLKEIHAHPDAVAFCLSLESGVPTKT